MNLHEYQAKALLNKYGIPTPKGEMTDNADKAGEIFSRLGFSVAAVKSQIHSGGRGKAGGIKVVKNPGEARAATQELIGKTLVTAQTGPAGRVVRKVLIEESIDAETTASSFSCAVPSKLRELYLGIVIDRQTSAPVMMASAEGGMEIEELARKSPEKIIKMPFHPHLGLAGFQARELVFALGLGSAAYADIFIKFSKLFIESDCSLAEINPLVVTNPSPVPLPKGERKGEGGLMALDAKINLDDRALFRHKDLAGCRDINEEHPIEYEASKYDLSYIGLDGNIGCMVNGAGLAMATMDLIKLHGGEPANFLDVGGGASAEQVTQAFKLLVSNKNVKAILVNIFGGIMKCDIIAQGIVTAVKEVGLNFPLVVRLEGTNVDIGKKILKESGLNIISADTMDEAAKRVVSTLKV